MSVACHTEGRGTRVRGLHYERPDEPVDHQYPVHDLPEDATNLLHLLYSMIMISFPVEAWGQQRVPATGSAAFDLFVEPVP